MSPDLPTTVKQIVDKAVAKMLSTDLGVGCGFKIVVSEEVPLDEVWFLDTSGGKHIIKNARPAITFNLDKGDTNES